MKSFVLSSLWYEGAIVLFAAILQAGVLQASDPPSPAHLGAAVNVNSRYIVEAVDLNGFNAVKLSDGLRDRIDAMIGQPYDGEAIDEIARELRKEIHAKAVTGHIAKGSDQERVRLVYDVTRRTAGLDISVPKFLYHAKQGWSGQVQASAAVSKNQTLTFGIVSDGDEIVERFAAINARYENLHLGSDKVRFQFLFESYHDQWNNTTTKTIEEPSALSRAEALDTPDLYRSRRNFQPVFTFVLAKPLALSVGTSIMRMNNEDIPSVQSESSNTLLIGLRYHKQTGTIEDYIQTFDSNYEFKSALRALGSDYVFTKHRWQGGYNWTKGRQSISDVVTAGFISGRAPLYERFVVGTGSLLRGWNRYDIDPLGGNRLLHNSLEYRYRMASVFYDCGSLWSLGRVPNLLHSVGIGVHQSIFSVALAFPIRTNGRIEPTLLVGMNY